MRSTTNTLYMFAAAAALALSSCKDKDMKQEGTTTDMDITSDTVKPASSDAVPAEDSTAINPDTIMGP
ncbi:hypothetical protein HYN59_10115 [Flavobacterium album]|uniref:Cytochrome C551 n=1 Tax=Flavobacterium album TaxID=2175091 RepID=A0A2S1QYH9_9FLAO|nr:hypothetical protein [Flavobacterium album]AWH85448.1 hypothetical protein HYN59_10115 [Flavobacterium album]